MSKYKRFFLLPVFLLVIVAIFLLVIATVMFFCSETIITESSDVTDYGVISDRSARKDFLAFFPKELSPAFEDIRYHFKYVDHQDFMGARSFEASLEFTISDPGTFSEYVSSIAPMDDFTVFPYDEHYLAYQPCIDSLGHPRVNLLELYLNNPKEDQEDPYLTYGRADIKLVLIDPEDHRVIYIFLETISDSDFVTRVNDLCDFFQRFDIDPAEYSRAIGPGILDSDGEGYDGPGWKGVMEAQEKHQRDGFHVQKIGKR